MPARRQLRHSSDFALDALEPRRLLTADLGVTFADFGFADTIVPGDVINFGIFVSNNGPMAAVGLVTVNLYASSDVDFDAGDVLLRSFPSEPISLSANDEGTFSDSITIPADFEPGDFFLLVRIVPNSAVNDTNQSNNVAATEEFMPIRWLFGDAPGRTGVTLFLEDADSVVSFALNGGGSGMVTKNSDGSFNISATQLGASSDLAIGVDGGDGQTIVRDFSLAGSLDNFSAPDVNLTGAFSISGSLVSLALRNAGGTALPCSISIGAVNSGVSIFLAAVVNASINSLSPLNTLSVASWTDNDSTLDLVAAPWIGELAATGNFGASLRLSGRADGDTLGSAAIGGQLLSGSWAVNGKGGAVSARASNTSWSGSFTQRLASFTITSIFRGTLAAKTIPTVSITFDLVGAKILAGANLGEDGRLGGTGDDADSFLAGSIVTLTVGRKVQNSIVGVGLDPFDGVFNNGDDRIRGGTNSKFTTITITTTASANSRFLAGRYAGTTMINGVVVNAASGNDRRFVVTELVAPTAVFLDRTPDSGGAFELIRITYTDNKKLRVGSIGTGDIRVVGPNGFAQTLSFVSVTPAGNGKIRTATYRLNVPGGAWTPSRNGEYDILLAANQVRDTSGNAAAAGELGTFQINV